MIVGSGIGGLAAGVDLARHGEAVVVLERAETLGGKLRTQGPARIDAGPTVFTMRWVFESLFDAAGASFSDAVTLRPAEILARHGWGDGSRLDLHADAARSADAIGAFAGAAERQGFEAFCAAARRMYRTLEQPFIKSGRPTPVSLVREVRSLPDLLAIRPFQTMWAALGGFFRDPRLQQLFGRYATYCGSSPFEAPATLMLIAHVEQEGVWLVEGGMVRVAEALAGLAQRQGAVLRTGAEVVEVLTDRGGACGVRLASGERIAASAVVLNVDAAAVAAGLLGAAVQGAGQAMGPGERSLSAVTWTGLARADGFPLLRHSVLFAPDSRAEFAALKAGRLPGVPTVYVCAQDRPAVEAPAPDAPERMLVLVNAPALGAELGAEEIERCSQATWNQLRACGLTLAPEGWTRTTPAGFAVLFPGTGGALYGAAVHGAMASFRRPGCRTRVPGLYLAGGSVHPGAGVPMATLSGRLAASALMADRASTRPSRRMAMPGGMSTR